MSTLALIVPIYNEEKLLPEFIANVVNHVDSLIFVDGSSYGISSDRSAEIIKSHDNVTYISGTYGLLNGIWDKKQQVLEGLKKADSDYVWLSSVDVLYSGIESIKEALESEPDVVYGNMIEFWLDVKHIRTAGGITVKSYPMICRKQYAKHYLLEDRLDTVEFAKVYLANAMAYHYGWIRCFESQVVKHTRNVLSGGWGDTGIKIIQKGERTLESWAIYHVLKYRDLEYIPSIVNAPGWRDMSCFDGLEDFSKKYQSKYKEDFYTGVMTTVPHELMLETR